MRFKGLDVSPEDLSGIHETALRALQESGIRTDHAAMRERMAAAGCRVAGERVFIPPDVVTAALNQVPPGFSLYGRATDQQVRIEPGALCCTNTGIFADIVDFETGAIRRSTLADVQATARLLDAMNHVDAVYVSLVDATEQPPHLVMLSDFAATIANTTKPLIGPGLANRAEATAVVSMAEAVRGGDRDQLRRFPLCVPFVCSISPFFFPNEVVAALEVAAEAGMPLDLLSNPVMGLTSPYTLAGAVAIGHAELLAFTVMAQLVRPGLPLLYQNTPSVADMRTLSSTTGGPETGLIRRAGVLLAQSLGIPACAHGHTSSARLDYQCGEEKMLNGLLIASAGPAVMGGLGALANVTLTAYETILLDNERYGAFLRTLDGMTVSAEHLPFDVIEALATSGDALAHPHTRRFLRSGEVWQPTLAVRQGLIDGAPPIETSTARARAEVSRLLATHHVQPLPEAVEQALSGILAAYGRDAG